MQAPLHLLSPFLKDEWPCDSLMNLCWESLQPCSIYPRMLFQLVLFKHSMEAILLQYDPDAHEQITQIQTTRMSFVRPSRDCWLWSSLTLWDRQCCSAVEGATPAHARLNAALVQAI